MKKKSILLLFGGESSEHDVSVASARNVHAAIDRLKFDVTLCYIDKSGKWWLLDQLSEVISGDDGIKLIPLLGTKSFVTIPGAQVIQPDVILPILHGRNGEDGSVQGLAQLLHIPIVGCDMESASICMNKVITKVLLQANDIAIVPYETHRNTSPAPVFSELEAKLGSPLFVKPARAGSSVGVSKVTNENELTSALAEAHRHDDIVLIEQAITARELEVAVLGTIPTHTTSVVGEIHAGDEFYSYDAKYSTESKSSADIPADISAQLQEELQLLACKVYEILGCKGLSRIDFFLDENEKVYVNEVNTLPGFTDISMYPKLWQYKGVSYSELIERLISLAISEIVTAE
jgi:D-alanine-D-alanine ligase